MTYKPKIAWLADVPGWAYHNRARRVADFLPDYEHVVVFNIVKNLGKALMQIRDADVVVCPDPRLLPFIAHLRQRVVQNVNAIKIFM